LRAADETAEDGPVNGHSVALVAAHPDDDAYGIAGSVALHDHEPGFRYILIHATEGEGGHIAEGFDATRGTLGRIRRQEDENAWAAHGGQPTRHEWLGVPDGGVADVPFEQLVEALAAILREEQPQVVCTAGPDGITGHPDHIAIGRATDEAFMRLRAEGVRGFDRLLHAAMKQSTIDRWNVKRIRDGLRPWDPNRLYDLRGVPDETIDVDIDTSSVASRVLAGLLEHRSQRHVMFDQDASDDDWKRVVSREFFVQAFPQRSSGEPVLHDIFEGIDPEM
jgi:LmbE family N-acetylglucosaminyl deacetylase